MNLSEKEKRESLHLLNAFAERMRRYEQTVQDPNIKGFLEELQAELDSGEEGAIQLDPDSGPELVKIMTVHAAKGLEFAHVYLVSLVDQRFPTRARRDAIPLPDGLINERLPEGDYHLEEERRLFYVAMTRAKQSLTLTGAKNDGGTREKKPSIFIEEADVVMSEGDMSAMNVAKAWQRPEGCIDAKDAERELFPLKRRFSFTQLAAFKKCPLQYKFEHVYRIPKFGNENKSFGQSVHLALQRIMDLHVKRKQSLKNDVTVKRDTKEKSLLVSKNEAMEIFEASWIDEWYESRDRHNERKEKGVRAINQLMQRYEKRAPNVRFVEKPFTLVLGQHSIKGTVDRVDELQDGSFAIYDYKTGKAKEELTPGDKEQLHLYQLALEGQGMEISKLTYIYPLNWVETEANILKEKKKDKFVEKIMKRMDDILTSSFEATPQAFMCRTCDFRNICEYKK